MDIIKGIKEVAEVVRKANNIDLYRQILDLQKEAMDLVEENFKLKREIENLQDDKQIKDNLVFKENQYFLIKDGKEDGPFCSACWDNRSKLIRINEFDYGMGLITEVCPVCTKNN